MLKNVFLLGTVVALSSCTAETYIEFDELNLTINGLEIDSSVGIDGQSVNELVDNSSEVQSSNTFELSNSSLLGNFIKEPATNNWHKVFITEDNSGNLRWNNLAGVSWSLEIKDEKLYSGPDCPYGIMELDLEISDNEVSAIIFMNERYAITECLDIDVEGIVDSFNSYPALGMTLEMYIDAVSNAFGMKDYFDGMSIIRAEGWDEWGSSTFGGNRSIGQIKFDISGSDIDMVLIYDVNTNEYLMTIFFNTPEFWQSRIHFGVRKIDGLEENGNSFWFECENVAFRSAIEWIKNYLG